MRDVEWDSGTKVCWGLPVWCLGVLWGEAKLLGDRRWQGKGKGKSKGKGKGKPKPKPLRPSLSCPGETKAAAVQKAPGTKSMKRNPNAFTTKEKAFFFCPNLALRLWK